MKSCTIFPCASCAIAVTVLLERVKDIMVDQSSKLLVRLELSTLLTKIVTEMTLILSDEVPLMTTFLLWNVYLSSGYVILIWGSVLSI